jgi:aspartyl-tRNA(Asn)/glutamyl-tRNA(Gln) amidotransferase subunit B
MFGSEIWVLAVCSCAANPDKVEQVKLKPTMLGWFVGQVMKGTGGKANPAAVNEILKKKLGI